MYHFSIYLNVGSFDTSVMSMKEITKIFLSGRISATLIIPIEMARRYGLEKAAHVVIEETPQGILIRKLEV
jgi:hypothetical protein